MSNRWPASAFVGRLPWQSLTANRFVLYALTLEAGIAALGERRSAADVFGKAESEFGRLNMPLHRAACAWRRAECLNDARGVAHAETQLKQLGVVNPARFSDMLAPRVQGEYDRRTDSA